MVSVTVELGLTVAWLLIAGFVVVQHWRGALPRQRVLLLAGTSATWLSYGLFQLTDDGPLVTGPRVNVALEALAVVLLFAGLFGLYRWWSVRRSRSV